MIDEREIVRRAAEALTPPEPSFDRVLRRRDRKHRNQRIRAGVLGIAIAIAVGWLGINAIRSTPSVPADPPLPRISGSSPRSPAGSSTETDMASGGSTRPRRRIPRRGSS